MKRWQKIGAGLPPSFGQNSKEQQPFFLENFPHGPCDHRTIPLGISYASSVEKEVKVAIGFEGKAIFVWKWKMSGKSQAEAVGAWRLRFPPRYPVRKYIILCKDNITRQYWKGLKVVTIEIIEIVTTIIVTTFKRCNNLNML